MNPLPPLEEFKARWGYCPETGIFTSLVNIKGVRVGDTIGGNSSRRYLQGRIRSKTYSLNRVAWLYITGEDPGDFEIDHINGDTLDNSAANLRLATHTENMRNQKVHRNNRLRARGVHEKPHGKFAASISCDGRRYNLGNFDSAHEASIAYRAAALVAHGIFQRVE